MPTQKIDPKVIFASDAPAIDKPPVFSDKTKGWDVARANDGRPQIKEMNKIQQDTDLKILWLNENSVTPYDESIDYPDGAVALKDGSFKQLVSGAWVEFLDDFANKDEVKRGIANRYDSSLVYNSGERVVLTNGDIVKSTIDGNTNDPNVDMTGWVRNDGTVSSISEMLAIQNPKNGEKFFVQGLQGGWFEFNQSKVGINDGVITFNGWVRITLETVIYPEWAGAIPEQDCTIALQKALDYCSPTAWLGSISAMNRIGGSVELRLTNKYRFTDTLWIGAYQVITGAGELGFNTENVDKYPALIADFTNPLKPALSSNNYKAGGVRVAYDEQTTGAQYDGGLVSATHGIKLNGFSLLTATGKHGYIGMRLQNSPQSEIKLFIKGFDYGVLANASWQSTINCRTMHYKCGLLAHLDNNGLNFDGYYNAMSGTPLDAKNLTDFFATDTDTNDVLNNTGTQFGVICRFNLAASARQVICELNDVGLVVCSGDASIQTLYSEYNRIASFVGYTTSTTIDNITGAGDASSFLLGTGAKLDVKNDSQSGIAATNRINKISRYSSYLIVPFTFPAYNKGIIYKNKKNVIYINSTSGNDLYSGLTTQYPLKTINAVFNRISEGYAFADSASPLKTLQNWEVVILDAGSYTITANAELTGNIHIYASNPANVPTITTNNYTRMSHCHLVFKGITVVRPNISFGDIAFENGAFWFKYGTNILEFIACSVSIMNYGLTYPEYIGASDSTLILNRCTTTGVSASQLVQSNYLDERPHIISVLRTGGTISAEITGRVDKGVSVPIAWQNKILGI